MELKFEQFDYNSQIDQQRELFKNSFPETNGDAIQGLDHYHWKFRSYPNEIKSWEYVCFSEDKMAGYYAAIPYDYKIGNKVITVGMVCDVMTSPDFRGKGIFTKLGKYSTGELASHVPFTMGYPIRKEVIPGHLKVGWKIPFSLPLYMKFLSLSTFLQIRKLGFAAPALNMLLKIYNNILFTTKINKNYSYKLFTNVDEVEGYDNFINEWSMSVKNTLVKNKSFAKWRYNAPERKYQFITIYSKDSKLIGFVSYRKIVKEGILSYGILDYMVLKNDCHGLINNVLIQQAKKDKVEIIMTMMSQISARKNKLQKNGFIKSPFTFQLIIKNLTNQFTDEELFDENNWHLMWIDSDDL